MNYDKMNTPGKKRFENKDVKMDYDKKNVVFGATVPESAGLINPYIDAENKGTGRNRIPRKRAEVTVKP